MPFTNGAFSRLRSWVNDAAAGLDMLPALMDADTNDIAGGLSNCLLRDGTGVPTADIPWNGKGITGLRAPQNPGDALGLGLTPSSEIARLISLTVSQAGSTVPNWSVQFPGGLVIQGGYNPGISVDIGVVFPIPLSSLLYIDAKISGRLVGATLQVFDININDESLTGASFGPRYINTTQQGAGGVATQPWRWVCIGVAVPTTT